MHKVYIGASLSAREEAKDLAIYLRWIPGVEVVSSWHEKGIYKGDNTEILEAIGWRNIIDLERASILILLTHKPSSSGGRHFEHGWAAARKLPVVIIGSTIENVFQNTYRVVYCTTIEAFKAVSSVVFK